MVVNARKASSMQLPARWSTATGVLMLRSSDAPINLKKYNGRKTSLSPIVQCCFGYLWLILLNYLYVIPDVPA